MNMETLLKDGNFVLFTIEFTSPKNEAFCEFSIYEVISWDTETNEPLEYDHYLTGSMKWDGCSNMRFCGGEYLQLCGKDAFENHNKVMTAVWKLCQDKFK